MALWVTPGEAVELRPGFSESDLQTVIRAVYRQVLGNAHLMDSERLTEEESQLRNGKINVQEFVLRVARSELYRKLFFEGASQYRVVEMNCKHLLGRAPLDQAEIAEHVQRYVTEGFEADLASYVYSDEYGQTFGAHTVPYARSNSQVGVKNSGFNRSFALNRGDATSDSSNAAVLISELAGNKATKIVSPSRGGGTPGQTNKRYRVSVAKPGAGPRFRRSAQTYEVDYASLSARIQNVQKAGGRILSISEVN